MKQKKWILLLISIGIFSMILFVYQSNKANTYQKTTKQLTKAQSWKDVKAFEYASIPGLKRAEKLGVTETFNKSIVIPGSNKEIDLHEMWYNKKQVVFFYSLPFDSIAFQQKVLKHKNLHIQTPLIRFNITSPTDDQLKSQVINVFDGNHNNGILYKGRLYRTATAQPLYKDNHSLVKLSKLKVENIELLDGQNMLEKIPQSTKIPVIQDLSNHYVTKSLNAQININSHPLAINKIEMGTINSKLYFHYKPRNGQLAYIIGKIKANKSLIPFGSIKNIGNNKYVMTTLPLDTIPKQLSFQINQLIYYGHDHYTFTFDPTSYLKHVDKNSKKTTTVIINKKITTIRNTDISLEKLSYNSQNMFFTLKYKPHNTNDQLSLYTRQTYIQKHPQTNNENKRPILTITNQSKQNLATGQATFGTHTTSFGLDSTKVILSNFIRFTAKNLMFLRHVNWNQTVLLN